MGMYYEVKSWVRSKCAVTFLACLNCDWVWTIKSCLKQPVEVKQII
jgi:hypothetical protein